MWFVGGETYVKRVIHGISDSFTDDEARMIKNSSISMAAGQAVVQVMAKPAHLQGGKQSSLPAQSHSQSVPVNKICKKVGNRQILGFVIVTVGHKQPLAQ